MTVLLPLTAQPEGPVGPGPIEAVAVVIPARDEQGSIGGCVDAVLAAAAQVSVPVAVLVVADRCTDATADRARARARESASESGPVPPAALTVLPSRVGRVGAARDRGVRAALRGVADRGGHPGRLWVANTDADSRVPADWLVSHLELAETGADLVLGTVRPDPTDLPADLLESWRRRQTLSDGHPHVHGANLGVRGDIYITAGGFPHIACHEDVRITDAVRRCGGRVVATGRSPVLTSGRRVGRAPAGLSSYLRELSDLDPSA